MIRPTHSAQRDRAFGRYYANRGARNAIVQAVHGGTPNTNAERVAEWRNKSAQIPQEIKDRPVPHGAGAVLIFRPVIKRPRLSLAR